MKNVDQPPFVYANLIAYAQPKLCNYMTQTMQLHSKQACDRNDAIYVASASFSTNQIAGSMHDYKINIINA
jgi:hypothetical protein